MDKAKIFAAHLATSCGAPFENHWSNGYGECFPGIKPPESEADDSTQFSAKVKNVWLYASTPAYVVMMKWLIN
jgi:hypothetical protein